MAPNQNAGDNDLRAVMGVKLLNQFVLVTEDDFFKLEEIALLTALKKQKSAPAHKEEEDA